jgi:hypothetical protein
MSENRNTRTFSAADLRRRMAEREAAKAAEEMRQLKEQQEKQKTVMAEFHKPPDKTPEQVMEPVMQLVNQAAERGHSGTASALIAGEGSTIRSPTGTRLWRAFLARATNSGAITFGRSASISGLRSWSTRVGCLAI